MVRKTGMVRMTCTNTYIVKLFFLPLSVSMFNFYLINLNIKAFEKITSCSERGFIIVGEKNRRR